jgi:hypothetical protein
MCERQYGAQFLFLKHRPADRWIIDVNAVEASVDLLIVESCVLLDARYLHEFDVKERVGGSEFAHNRRYRSVNCRRNKTDTEFAPFALDGIGNPYAHLLDATEDSRCFFEEQLADRGQAQRSRAPVNELRPNLGFEVLDLAAQGWLRDIQAICGLREASLVSHHDKIPKQSEIHLNTLWV